MKNKKGFTLVELVVTMVISAILALIAVPSILKWYHKDQFLTKSREITDMINDARVNALSNKKCADSYASVAWAFNLKKTTTATIAKLICLYNDNNNSPQQIEFSILNLNNNINLKDIYKIILTEGLINNPNIFIKFPVEKEATSMIIENNIATTSFDIKKIRMIFEFPEDATEERTICFDRIAGFPTVSKTEQCAE